MVFVGDLFYHTAKDENVKIKYKIEVKVVVIPISFFIIMQQAVSSSILRVLMV